MCLQDIYYTHCKIIHKTESEYEDDIQRCECVCRIYIIHIARYMMTTEYEYEEEV